MNEKALDLENIFVIFRQLSRVFMIVVGIGIAIPVLAGLIFGMPPARILTLIISTAILQTWSSPVGIGLKIPPGVILFVIVCFSLSIVLAIFEILDTLALTSPRIRSWLEKTEKKMGKYKILYKYGPFACFFIALLPGLGLVITAVIAWALRFSKWLSILSIVFAFFLASLLVMLLTLGILPQVSPF